MMTGQNNKLVLPGLPPVGNPEIIKVLDDALQLAKQGKIAGVAVVVAFGPDALSSVTAGAFPSTLVVGCHKTAAQLIDGMFNRKSPIIPARMS